MIDTPRQETKAYGWMAFRLTRVQGELRLIGAQTTNTLEPGEPFIDEGDHAVNMRLRRSLAQAFKNRQDAGEGFPVVARVALWHDIKQGSNLITAKMAYPVQFFVRPTLRDNLKNELARTYQVSVDVDTALIADESIKTESTAPKPSSKIAKFVCLGILGAILVVVAMTYFIPGQKSQRLVSPKGAGTSQIMVISKSSQTSVIANSRANVVHKNIEPPSKVKPFSSAISCQKAFEEAEKLGSYKVAQRNKGRYKPKEKIIGLCNMQCLDDVALPGAWNQESKLEVCTNAKKILKYLGASSP